MKLLVNALWCARYLDGKAEVSISAQRLLLPKLGLRPRPHSTLTPSNDTTTTLQISKAWHGSHVPGDAGG